jgi:hypothetical protein
MIYYPQNEDLNNKNMCPLEGGTMEKAIEWAKHLIEEVSRRSFKDKVECSQVLSMLIRIAVGERTYEMGDLVEVTSLLTGSTPSEVTVLTGSIAVESQLAIAAFKVADSIRKFEESYQTEPTASGRFRRFILGEEPEDDSHAQRVMENFHYLCGYLKVDKPEIAPEEVKLFLQTVSGAMPRLRSRDQPAP